MSVTALREDRARRLAGASLWLRGSVAMAADAYSGTVNLVAGVHRAVSRTGAAVNPFAAPERVTRDFVYACVRETGAASFYGARSVVSLTAHGAPAAADDVPARLSQTLRSALNGAVGDYLEASRNELALPMQFIDDQGQAVDCNAATAIPAGRATPRLVVLIHGLGMHDGHWRHADAPDFGDRLVAEHDYTALRLRYNSGRRIADNGRELAERLEALVAGYPIALSRITLIGHSMGGLVARNAVRHAKSAGHAWVEPLADVICLGSPHLGAPLERLGNGANRTLTLLPYTRPFSAIGELRSAGVKDLRHGHPFEPTSSVVVDDTNDIDAAIGHFLVAATLGRRHADPVDRWFGDLLVPVASAFGHSPSATAAGNDGCVFYGMSHFALVHHEDVYDAIVEWLGPRLARPVAGRPTRRLDSIGEAHVTADIYKRFDEAVNNVRNTPEHGEFKPSPDFRLKMYGLYRQAVDGDMSGKKPGVLDPVARYKWRAWKKNEGMSRGDAMAVYVAAADSIAAEYG